MRLSISKSALLICLSISTFAVGQNQPARFFENNGGLLDRNSPLAVPDRNATAIADISLDTRGQLVKRAGDIRLNALTAISTGNVTGGRYHNAATGNDFFGILVGTTVWRTGNTFAGSYTNVTSTVTLTNTASNLAQATSLNDTEIFCNELDKPFKLGSTGNAVQISTPLFTGAKTCATYGNYLVIGNTTESTVAFPSRIRWSDINSPDSFPALNFIDVEPNDGDKVVSVVTFDDSVYIFKKRGIYRMLITGLDGPDAFIIRPVARNIGAWAKNSVKVIPNVGIAFLAQNTVYVLNDSGLDPIGDNIQRSFDAVSRNMWANAVAEVYPKRYQYWLAVSTTTDSQNHEVLVYDYIQKAWSIYTGLNVNMLAQAEDSSGNNLMLTGDYKGNHYKQDTTATTDDDNGATKVIKFSYTTPDYALQSPEYTKNFKYLYVFFNVVTSSVTVSAAFDYGTTFDYSQTIGLGQIGALYDSGIYDTDIFPNSITSATRIEINRSAKAIKLRFDENSSNSFGIVGWALVYEMEDWK